MSFCPDYAHATCEGCGCLCHSAASRVCPICGGPSPGSRMCGPCELAAYAEEIGLT